MKISLVIPLFNEESGVQALIKRLSSVISTFTIETELILIDDGSSDDTMKNLTSARFPCKTTILSFSRNFGHQSALLAGLKSAAGDIVVTLDGDLQHPPELIPSMIELHKQGYDIVFTKRNDASRLNLKHVTSVLFYKLMNLLSSTPIPLNSSDFRSMNRKSLSAFLELPEKNIFLRGMVSWIGFKSVAITYEPETRTQGSSKYSLAKMIDLALNGIVSFSTRPLSIALYASALFFMMAMIYAAHVLFIRFVLQEEVSGWASILFMILFASGFFSAYLALLSLYISAIFNEVKRRPEFIISKRIIK